MSKHSAILLLVLVLGLGIIAGFAWLHHYTTQNIVLGEAKAEAIMNTMVHTGTFSWSSSEYRLIAVVDCRGVKTFVEKLGKRYSSEFIGCSYEIAQDIYINPVGDPWSQEGFITFTR